MSFCWLHAASGVYSLLSEGDHYDAQLTARKLETSYHGQDSILGCCLPPEPCWLVHSRECFCPALKWQLLPTCYARSVGGTSFRKALLTFWAWLGSLLLFRSSMYRIDLVDCLTVSRSRPRCVEPGGFLDITVMANP